MPFVQVGTSRNPRLSRGADYTFTWTSELSVSRCVRVQGRRVMRRSDASRDLTPKSLRGLSFKSLTLGITRETPASVARASPI